MRNKVAAIIFSQLHSLLITAITIIVVPRIESFKLTSSQQLRLHSSVSRMLQRFLYKDNCHCFGFCMLILLTMYANLTYRIYLLDYFKSIISGNDDAIFNTDTCRYWKVSWFLSSTLLKSFYLDHLKTFSSQSFKSRAYNHKGYWIFVYNRFPANPFNPWLFRKGLRNFSKGCYYIYRKCKMAVT